MSIYGEYSSFKDTSKNKVIGVRTFFQKYFKATVRNKMITTSAILALIVVVAVSTIIVNSYLAETATQEVLSVYKPRYEHSVQIVIHIKEAQANLGIYVISQNKKYLEQYYKHMKMTYKSLDNLMTTMSGEPEYVGKMEHIKVDIDNISVMIDEIIRLQDELVENVPGLVIANTKLEPRGQLVSGLIQSVLQKAANQEHINSLKMESFIKLSLSWARIRSGIRAFLAFRTQRSADAIKVDIEVFEENIKEVRLIEDLGISFESTIDEIQKILPDYNFVLDELITKHTSQLWRKDITIMEKRIDPVLRDLNNDLEKLIERYAEKSTDSSNKALKLLKQNSRDGLIAIVIVILSGILILMYMMRSVLVPLQTALDTMQDIADEGNLENTLPAEGVDEYSDMGKAFNQFIKKIKGVVDLVIHASKNLVSESDRLSLVTSKSEQRAVQQEDEIKEVSNTFQQLNDSMQIVQSNTSAAAEAANAANRHSENGQRVVGETVKSMGALADQVDTTHSKIEELYEMSNKIGAVVKVIRGITDQTNLLALNAAIEAARAGEQGRGFAVVADEVRNLSQDVQKETDSVDAQIAELQNAVSEALDSMVKSQHQTKDNVEMVGKAGEALREIYTSVNIITDMNVSIAEEINGQSQQSKAVLDKLHSILSIAEESAGSARDASSLGNEFKILAQQLEDMVNQFLLSKNEEEIDLGNISNDDIELF